MQRSDPDQISTRRLPAGLRIAVLLAAVPVGLLSLFGLAVGCVPGVFGIDEPMWILAGFEAVMLAAAVFVCLVACGKFGEGRELTLGIAATSIAVCAVLESLSFNHTVGDVSLRPFLLGRLAGAGIIGLAVLPMTLVAARQWQRLIIGAVILSPVAVLVAPIGLSRMGIATPDVIGHVTGLLDQAGPAVALFATLFGGLLGIAVLSIGGHLVITAFDASAAPTKATGTESEE